MCHLPLAALLLQFDRRKSDELPVRSGFLDCDPVVGLLTINVGSLLD